MKLAQIITQYVDFRRNLGEKFEVNAALLQMFSRAIGENADISEVQADRVKTFLDAELLQMPPTTEAPIHEDPVSLAKI